MAADGDDGEDIARFDLADSLETRDLKSRYNELREEHRALDAAILALAETGGADPLQVARLKKRKLALRDQLAWLEDRLTPDIIA
jgi:hypothetical protein